MSINYTHSLRDCVFLVHEFHLWVENLSKLDCMRYDCDDNKFEYKFFMWWIPFMLSLSIRRCPIYKFQFIKSFVEWMKLTTNLSTKQKEARERKSLNETQQQQQLRISHRIESLLQNDVSRMSSAFILDPLNTLLNKFEKISFFTFACYVCAAITSVQKIRYSYVEYSFHHIQFRKTGWNCYSILYELFR